MTLTAILFLIAIGGVLIVLEFLFLPGLIAGIIGLLMQIAGIWSSYQFYGTRTGNWTLLSVVCFDIAILVYAFRGGMWRKITLKTSLKGKTNELKDNAVTVGDNGTTISRLAPAGKATLNGHILEVHSLHGFIDQQSQIVIVKIDAGKIWVKKV
jgi:membrane-bound ClpP family serine protease